MPISIFILTKNEESNIRAWFESVREFEDIVVLDSSGTDCTVEFTKSMRAWVVKRALET